MAVTFRHETAAPFYLKNARVPRSSLREGEDFESADRDGLVRVDLHIEDGAIKKLRRAGEGAVPERDIAQYDLAGQQVWPTFVDLHTHLDKGHIWPRAWSPDGTIVSARERTAADRVPHWNEADVERRFEFGLRCAFAHGTSVMRSHLDCFELPQAHISWKVFRTLRDRWAGRIALQAASLTLIDAYLTADGQELVELVAQSGGILGGVTRTSDPLRNEPEFIDACLDRLMTFAIERGLDIDLHVDESGDPAANTLAQVARMAMKRKFKGSVVCGHCCSLSVQDEKVVRDTIELCKDAGLTIVSLPMVNQFLQGRADNATPRWRGITLLRELKNSGVPVVLASDNCRDPYFAFGDHDMLEVIGQGVRIGHLDHEFGRWCEAVTTTPARTMRLAPSGTISENAPADLVVFRARSMSELLSRPQSDRVVLRKGRSVETGLPDYRELDELFVA